MSKPFRISVYTHGVRVSDLNLSITVQLKPFLDKLTQRETVEHYDYRSDKTTYETVVKKKYYVLTEDGKELFIHRNCLDELLEGLTTLGLTDYTIDELPLVDGEYAEITTITSKTPRDYQEVIIEALIDAKTTRNVCLGAGMGKALPLDTPVRVPNGFKPMGSIRVGDTVVAGNGASTTVTGWYPDDNLEGYRVTLEDGRTLDACKDHQFSVRVGVDTQWQTLVTSQMVELITDKVLYLPLAGYGFCDDIDLPFNPYNDVFPIWQDEQDIPECVMDGSWQQRNLFLEALFDLKEDWEDDFEQDGYSFSFSAPTLSQAKGIQRLCWSMGAICHLNEDTLHLDVHHLSTFNDDFEEEEARVIRVVNVAPIPNFAGACISVEHPSKLYQAGDYIVTHNTFCATKAVEKLKSRTILMLLPKYFGLWEKAIREDITSNPSIEYVKGYKSLIDIIERAVNNKPIADIIFMSATTYRSYIECLERYGSEGMKEIGYLVPPYMFHSTLGIGIQINDEIQDDPGLYFRIDTLLNVKKEIFLTATPYTGDERLTEMIRVMMPEGCDVPIPEASKYTHVVAIRYNDIGVRTGDYRGYKGAYSHVNYEASILKNKARREAYFSKVARVAYHFFVREYQEGQKMIIYCATTAFIEALVRYLKKKFPERSITEYISKTDFEQVQVNDIVVTTIKSAGAGVDIPNLKEALMLVATNSKKDNIQAMRRPRPLVNYDNLNPRFSYFVCNQIPKHLGYGQNRKGFFAPFALTHVDRLIR